MSKEADKRATENLLSSEGRTFAGIEIGPFTPRCQAVASRMGMCWPWIEDGDEVVTKAPVPIPAAELKKIPKAKRPADGCTVITITHYRQSFEDSVIALWLCSQPLSRVMRAGRNEAEAETALDEAWKWAEKIGLRMGSELSGEALIAWINITGEVSESKGEPKSKDSEEEEGEGSGEL